MNPDTYTGSGTNNTGITNPALGNLNKIGGTDGLGFFEKLIPSAVGLLFIVGGVSFFFMLVWGAISWILSGGDKAHLESAKGRITSAVMGIILLIASFAIVGLIETFFNINILSIDIGPLFIR